MRVPPQPINSHHATDDSNDQYEASLDGMNSGVTYSHLGGSTGANLSCSGVGPFRHSDISVKAVNQHGGRVLIYIV